MTVDVLAIPRVRRGSLLLAELADGGAFTVDDVVALMPPDDRIRTGTAYALMGDLEGAGIVDRIPPRPGEYQWRIRLVATPPQEWRGLPVPRR